jgi:tRNA modification GTPase
VTSPADTCVVLLTGAGRAAVASLRIEGTRALAIAEALFQSASNRPLGAQACDRILVGRWQDAAVGEEVVVCRRGAEAIEVHCHGGHAAAGAIIASLVERGCVVLDWRDWIRRTTADPLQAEARIALADALTERTALVLWDQHAGALGRAIDEIAVYLANGDAAAATERLDALLAWSALGQHLTTPWKVVLAGLPNVGKSSLANALLGYDRAIVHHAPGTTRDVVTAATAIDGWPIELADTAGLRAGGDTLEVAGMELARGEAKTADLVLLVVDRSQPHSADDDSLARAWPAALRVLNKCDLPAARAGEGIAVSALRGDGLEALMAAIGRRLVPRAPEPGQALPFTRGQAETLAAARRSLVDADLAAAGKRLAALRPASS